MYQDEMIIVRGQKKLRRGYTTGTTATAATKRSMLLLAESFGDMEFERLSRKFIKDDSGEVAEYVSEVMPVKTKKGIEVFVEVRNEDFFENISDGKNQQKDFNSEANLVEQSKTSKEKNVSKSLQTDDFQNRNFEKNLDICEENIYRTGFSTTIKKSGDDPDVTDGAEISSKVFFEPKSVFLENRKNKKFNIGEKEEQTSSPNISGEKQQRNFKSATSCVENSTGDYIKNNFVSFQDENFKNRNFEKDSNYGEHTKDFTDSRSYKFQNSNFEDESNVFDGNMKNGYTEPKKYLYKIDKNDFTFSEVEECEKSSEIIIAIYGGSGVGYVTKKGLAPKKGYSAINPVPRQMIVSEIAQILQKAENLRRMCDENIIMVEISVKNGEEIAKKTFNQKLGIVGGISILGTGGIVEPMSEQALVDTIKTELNQFFEIEKEKPLLICPGNYGQDFAKNILKLDLDKSVKISNYIGEALDHIVFLGIKDVLLVGHAGKLIKIAASVMNTHSSYADGRAEVMISHSAIFGAKIETLNKIMRAISVEEMIDALKDEGEEIFENTMNSITGAIKKSIEHRTKGNVNVEFIVFTNADGVILKSENAEKYLFKLQENK